MPTTRHRPLLQIGMAVLLAVLSGALVSSAAARAEEFVGKVISIADGDTITVLHARRPQRIRLSGIDAPEKGQPFGESARQFTARLAFGHEVTVHVSGHDRYGRSLAEVLLPDGRNLNQELVRAGYAWWYRRYSRDVTLAELEAQARLARVGLWADPHPMAPWEWRKSQALAAAVSIAGH
jgi:micrococcal nuclease